ncbi:hypothetical protein V6N11_072226 [Hibiscus sabdariffa]|uniref:ATP-grasp fold succinyl-CoA synthetase-type domain-containing protein n=1 Tax=Hibiscus sabdariffa TaxID=183260 RepID=A0ABR2U2G1_9ROSI
MKKMQSFILKAKKMTKSLCLVSDIISSVVALEIISCIQDRVSGAMDNGFLLPSSSKEPGPTPITCFIQMQGSGDLKMFDKMGVRENKVKDDENIDVKCDSSNMDSEINPERYAVMVSEIDYVDLDEKTQGVVALMKEKALVNMTVKCEDQFSVVQFVNQGNIIGKIFVTKQTSPQGKVVSKVYMVACSKGETNIENHIKKYPDIIIKVPIVVFKRITDEDAIKRVDGLISKIVDRTDSIKQVKKLYKLFYEVDCTLLEINSLHRTSSNQLVDVDAKLNFNDNYAFCHKYIFSLCDPSQEDPREVATAKADMNYTCLYGEINCMVNGGGLAMATIHIIKLRGGTTTNFFDVDGNDFEGQVVEYEIPEVKEMVNEDVFVLFFKLHSIPYRGSRLYEFVELNLFQCQKSLTHFPL